MYNQKGEHVCFYFSLQNVDCLKKTDQFTHVEDDSVKVIAIVDLVLTTDETRVIS